jgi:hypothetical protein
MHGRSRGSQNEIAGEAAWGNLQDAADSGPGLFDGDTGDAAAEARMVITYLTRNRVLLGRDDPQMWDALVEHEAAVVRHFHNMYVDLVIHRGSKVAFKQQVTPDRVPFSVTVRAVTLSREASVLALYARERLAHAVRGETVVITRADARSQMEPYWPVQVSNKPAKEKKVGGAIESLVQQDLLIKLGDDQWEVSPAIALVLTAPAIDRFTDLLTSPDASEGAGGHLALLDATDENNSYENRFENDGGVEVEDGEDE